jgi:hypothetical protein
VFSRIAEPEAARLVSDDPTVKAGLLRPVLHKWWCAAHVLPAAAPVFVNNRHITPGFFKTIQIPPVEGRLFLDSDSRARWLTGCSVVLDVTHPRS